MVAASNGRRQGCGALRALASRSRRRRRLRRRRPTIYAAAMTPLRRRPTRRTAARKEAAEMCSSAHRTRTKRSRRALVGRVVCSSRPSRGRSNRSGWHATAARWPVADQDDIITSPPLDTSTARSMIEPGLLAGQGMKRLHGEAARRTMSICIFEAAAGRLRLDRRCDDRHRAPARGPRLYWRPGTTGSAADNEVDHREAAATPTALVKTYSRARSSLEDFALQRRPACTSAYCPYDGS